jgi:hypothetical protein
VEAALGVSGVPELTWSQADAQAILFDITSNAWHAGIVKDILATASGNVIVATDTGGVWSVGETGGGVSLFDTDKPDMWCLGQGPDGDEHVFAGGITLFETDVSQAAPLLAWNEVVVTAANGNGVGTIYDIAILPETRKIVVATQTGIYWSEIPPAVGAGGRRPSVYRAGTPQPRLPYDWNAAQGLPPGAFGAVVLGGVTGHSQSIVAAAWGSNPSTGLFGLFFGTWTGGTLAFERATISGVDATQLCYTALTSCALFPVYLYASASDGAGNLVALLTSVDGGRNWTLLPGTLKYDPHEAGGSIYTYCTGQGNDSSRPCNAIGVGPKAAGQVALGWRSGPFLSDDGGKTFIYLHDGGYDPNPGDGSKYLHMHGDFHAMYFDVNDPSGARLYVGSDGGIVRTDDLGQTFTSAYNQRLLNLQMLGPAAARESYGSFGCSPATPGLVATGTQDNGNVFSLLGGAPQSWTYLEGGDGNLATFTVNGAFIHYSNADGRVQSSLWDGTTLESQGAIPYVDGRYLENDFFERVEQPVYRNEQGRLMYGIAGTSSWAYGLYADDDGRNGAWSYLASVDVDPYNPSSTIKAIGSRDGTIAFVGTAGGSLFAITPPSDVPTELVNTALSNHGDLTFTICRIVVANADLAFASFNRTDKSSGSVLRFDGNQWALVPGNFPNEFIYAMEIDDTGDAPVVYVATDANVYGSADFGNSWTNVSSGLPRRCHASDLRFYQDSSGHYLYLSTFGRSLWIARTFSYILARP